MKFNDTITFLYARFATVFKVEIERNLVEFKLHSGQIFILFALWDQDGMSQIALSEALNLSPPTINKMVKSLQRNGYVICNASPSDGRVVNIYLTPRSVAIRPQIETVWNKLEEKLLANLTKTEQLVLNQLFGKLVENFTLPQIENE